MKKVLVYLEKEKLAPKGGPYGYIYNLMDGLDKVEKPKDLEINLIEGINGSTVGDRVKKMKAGPAKTAVQTVKNLVSKGKLLYGANHKAMVDLSGYDLVHFHSTRMMFAARDSLKDYTGKVALTSHAPTLLSKEVYDGLTDFERKFFGWFYKKLICIDEYAFARADYLIFPCQEAEEPYYNNWDKYAALHQSHPEKFKYFATGTLPKTAKLSRSEVRKKYNIPSDAFVVSYVGRHNEIKGYGDLKEIATEVLKKNKDIYFLIAGKEEPMKGLDHPHWVEAGWTDDPGSVIQGADMFILPNRETYFDLVMLEVLSLKQLVLASRTGGNKYFEKYNDTGILLYSNKNAAVEQILKLSDCQPEKLEQLRQKNLDLYRQEFTTTAFASNYIKILEELLY